MMGGKNPKKRMNKLNLKTIPKPKANNVKLLEMTSITLVISFFSIWILFYNNLYKNRGCMLSKIKSINDISITDHTLEGNIVNN